MLNNKHKDTKLDQAIIIFPNVASFIICDEIVKTYKDAELWKESHFYSKKQGIRTCNEIRIPASALDTSIFNVVTECLAEYNKVFMTTATTDEGYTLLRYKEGQCIGDHMDDTTGLGRVLSCSILLNDDFTGGEFSFWGGEKIISLTKGSVVMFPSNFMYPHKILPVENGTRYSIITWLK